ncbi:hypothetical protein [Nonomuraea sp. NPDC023979]|uniref:hypothetical protein n=1 Tax=Nonomuraea sp. NPDC023979 TaxID=3154796 RepID=UPI0033DFDD5E
MRQATIAPQPVIVETCGMPGAEHTKALFLNARSRRLSARSATAVLNRIADRTGIRIGVVIAEVHGHSLETARRYSLPTDADRQAAIDKLTVGE